MPGQDAKIFIVVTNYTIFVLIFVDAICWFFYKIF